MAFIYIQAFSTRCKPQIYLDPEALVPSDLEVHFYEPIKPLNWLRNPIVLLGHSAILL